jgi:exodeoxyribonuclease VII small subunit
MVQLELGQRRLTLVSNNAKSYREMAEELDQIMQWFESGDLDIDEAVKKYEEATKLLNEMEKYLKTAENKIKKITTKKTTE